MSARQYAKQKREQRYAAAREALGKLSPGKPNSVNGVVVEKQTRWDGRAQAHVVTFLVGTAGGQTKSMTIDQAVHAVTGGV